MSRDCLLCGAAGDVELRMIRWREPLAGESFTTLPRCVDRVGCRARLEALGEDWPVADGTPATYRRREPDPVVEPEAEPNEAVEVTPSWL